MRCFTMEALESLGPEGFEMEDAEGGVGVVVIGTFGEDLVEDDEGGVSSLMTGTFGDVWR